MTSLALKMWSTDRVARLDRLIEAHPGAPGSRTDPAVSREWTQALVLRLASEFQGFSRELHDEVIHAVAGRVAAPDDRIHRLLIGGLAGDRRLDRVSAGSAALRGDFSRFGIDLWALLQARYPAAPGWQRSLQLLHRARNGFAHDDSTAVAAVNEAAGVVDLALVRTWRLTLDEIARAMDDVVGRELAELFGKYPWR